MRSKKCAMQNQGITLTAFLLDKGTRQCIFQVVKQGTKGSYLLKAFVCSLQPTNKSKMTIK